MQQLGRVRSGACATCNERGHSRWGCPLRSVEDDLHAQARLLAYKRLRAAWEGDTPPKALPKREHDDEEEGSGSPMTLTKNNNVINMLSANSHLHPKKGSSPPTPPPPPTTPPPP